MWSETGPLIEDHLHREVLHQEEIIVINNKAKLSDGKIFERC
jgi:hypothetical protein